MNIGEKYNKTNIHHQICIEKADFLVRFFVLAIYFTLCDVDA